MNAERESLFPFGFFLRLLGACGIRRGEVCDLKWKDVHRG